MTFGKVTNDTFNVTDEAVMSPAIPVDSIASVKLIDAQTDEQAQANPRYSFIVYNSGNKTLWVKFQATGIDDEKKGTPVFAGQVRDFSFKSGTYTGEISGIMDSGLLRDVYVQWW